MIQLYPDQLVARRAIYAAFRAGTRRVLQQAPTAFGKGTLATVLLSDCAAAGRRAVFVAHLSEINRDLLGRLRAAGQEPRILMGDASEGPTDALVWVVSEQTAARRGLRLDGARLVIRDEAHRAASASHAAVSAAAPDDAFHLGTTATPERGDGRPLDFYEVLLTGPSPLALVTAGRIAPVVTYAPAQPGPALARDPVEAWPLRPDGRPRPGIVFAQSLAHSRELAIGLCRRGFRAAHVDADTPQREEIVARFNGGDLDVLTCYRLFVEGVDVARSEVTMLACSMGHPGPFLQAIGRSRRIYPGKTSALLIDLTDNVSRLGLPDDDRIYSLTGRAGIALAVGPAAIPVRCCQACLAWSRAARVCPYCRAELPPIPPPRLSKRELVEQLHARQSLTGLEFEEWAAWVRGRRAKGKTPQQIVAGWMFAKGRPSRFTVAQVPVEQSDERRSA